MIKKANFASMSVDELWEIHEEISKLLEAKILTEKKMLERRLISLHPAKTDLKAHRPYPPVVPKFANPDDPSQVWSGRGKPPQWVTGQKSLSTGFPARPTAGVAVRARQSGGWPANHQPIARLADLLESSKRRQRSNPGDSDGNRTC